MTSTLSEIRRKIQVEAEIRRISVKKFLHRRSQPNPVGTEIALKIHREFKFPGDDNPPTDESPK
jgi:hypothetical protein